MSHDFREQAKQALKNAKSELEADEDSRVRYAALELRFCIEALTYDRAQVFEEELPSSEWDVWQPKKVMETLLEIEPWADRGSTISIKTESASGGVDGQWQMLGTEVVFTLAQIKKSYDALGNFLHYPTLKQIRTQSVDIKGMREKCQKIATQLESALASKMYNVNFTSNSSFKCNKCGEIIRKRLRKGDSELKATCRKPGCGAIYEVGFEGDDVFWKPLGTKVKCPSEGCNELFFVGREDFKVGSWWRCSSCKISYELALGVQLKAG